jgi:hypothetical protein
MSVSQSVLVLIVQNVKVRFFIWLQNLPFSVVTVKVAESFFRLLPTVWLCLRAGFSLEQCVRFGMHKAIAAFQGKFTKQELEKQLWRTSSCIRNLRTTEPPA